MSTSGAAKGDGSPRSESDESFPIEELARRTGMTVRTLRAYQSRKLLPSPEVRARMGYYSARHVARVELVKDLQAEGFKLDTIARMLDSTGESDAEILQFSRTVKSLFGESEPQIVNLEDLRERFPNSENELDLINRAEKLGLLRKLDDNTYEELAPRVLSAGQDAMVSLHVDARRALKLVEQLRRHAEGVAKLYLELYLEAVWKPFADAGQPDDEWPAVQTALERLRGIAEEALLGMFDVTMAERVDETFGREFSRMTGSSRSSSGKSHSSRSHSSRGGHPHGKGDAPASDAKGIAGEGDGKTDADTDGTASEGGPADGSGQA